MTTIRKPAAVRLRPETHEILDLLVQDTGLTRTGVMELAVHDLAKRRRVPSRSPSPPSPIPQVQRKSLLGTAADVPGGSEEFVRLKRLEKDRDDVGRGPRP